MVISFSSLKFRALPAILCDTLLLPQRLIGGLSCSRLGTCPTVLPLATGRLVGLSHTLFHRNQSDLALNHQMKTVLERAGVASENLRLLSSRQQKPRLFPSYFALALGVLHRARQRGTILRRLAMVQKSCQRSKSFQYPYSDYMGVYCV